MSSHDCSCSDHSPATSFGSQPALRSAEASLSRPVCLVRQAMDTMDAEAAWLNWARKVGQCETVRNQLTKGSGLELAMHGFRAGALEPVDKEMYAGQIRQMFTEAFSTLQRAPASKVQELVFRRNGDCVLTLAHPGDVNLVIRHLHGQPLKWPGELGERLHFWPTLFSWARSICQLPYPDTILGHPCSQFSGQLIWDCLVAMLAGRDCHDSRVWKDTSFRASAVRLESGGCLTDVPWPREKWKSFCPAMLRDQTDAPAPPPPPLPSRTSQAPAPRTWQPGQASSSTSGQSQKPDQASGKPVLLPEQPDHSRLMSAPSWEDDDVRNLVVHWAAVWWVPPDQAAQFPGAAWTIDNFWLTPEDINLARNARQSYRARYG
jgi:hypothetical protein